MCYIKNYKYLELVKRQLEGSSWGWYEEVG